MQPGGSPTKTMFDCLVRLYKQSQLLLIDADRLMGERGWEAMHTTGPAELSNSLNSPERWFARWATRFYKSVGVEEEKGGIDRILFVGVHFASDHDTVVDEPVVSAGRLTYDVPMDTKAADQNYHYWMCKYWFYGKPHSTVEGWRQAGRTRYAKNLLGSETFVVPLYDITSSEELERLVIQPLLAFEDTLAGPEETSVADE